MNDLQKIGYEIIDSELWDYQWPQAISICPIIYCSDRKFGVYFRDLDKYFLEPFFRQVKNL